MIAERVSEGIQLRGQLGCSLALIVEHDCIIRIRSVSRSGGSDSGFAKILFTELRGIAYDRPQQSIPFRFTTGDEILSIRRRGMYSDENVQFHVRKGNGIFTLTYDVITPMRCIVPSNEIPWTGFDENDFEKLSGVPGIDAYVECVANAWMRRRDAILRREDRGLNCQAKILSHILMKIAETDDERERLFLASFFNTATRAIDEDREPADCLMVNNEELICDLSRRAAQMQELLYCRHSGWSVKRMRPGCAFMSEMRTIGHKEILFG
jgi:hypothetical protein